MEREQNGVQTQWLAPWLCLVCLVLNSVDFWVGIFAHFSRFLSDTRCMRLSLTGISIALSYRFNKS